jgi:hypothetical protein
MGVHITACSVLFLISVLEGAVLQSTSGRVPSGPRSIIKGPL